MPLALAVRLRGVPSRSNPISGGYGAEIYPVSLIITPEFCRQGFASQAVVATLGSFSLVNNVILSPCLLGEKVVTVASVNCLDCV